MTELLKALPCRGHELGFQCPHLEVHNSCNLSSIRFDTPCADMHIPIRRHIIKNKNLKTKMSIKSHHNESENTRDKQRLFLLKKNIRMYIINKALACRKYNKVYNTENMGKGHA